MFEMYFGNIAWPRPTIMHDLCAVETNKINEESRKTNINLKKKRTLYL